MKLFQAEDSQGASMKALPNRKGNCPPQGSVPFSSSRASMKALPKRKGNSNHQEVSVKAQEPQ